MEDGLLIILAQIGISILAAVRWVDPIFTYMAGRHRSLD